MPLSHSKYIHRELSWLEFNQRVLAEAREMANPPMERLKFLGITANNLDEFFMVRIASLAKEDPAYDNVYQSAFGQMRAIEQYYLIDLEPVLREKQICHVKREQLSDSQQDFLQQLFLEEILPQLTPIALRSKGRSIHLNNLGLYLAFYVVMPGHDPDEAQVAVVELPRNLNRILTLKVEKGYAYFLLEDLVALYAHHLFKGYVIQEQGLFRLTRAAEMTLDEEKDEDFSKVMSRALRKRRRNIPVRLEYIGSDTLLSALKKLWVIPEHKIFRSAGILDLKTISKLAFLPRFEALQRKTWVPRPHPAIENTDNIFELILKEDILMHHPYESFEAFMRFLSQAARDPDVLAIKQTLYRVHEGSNLIPTLIDAAKRGKQVTVLVELKARFDEELNISWADQLENAGATVIYGVAGLKTHAKACLVVRREPEGIRRYVHLGTGNYNEQTAKLYTDIGLFTCDSEIAQDVAAVFNTITGFSQPVSLAKLHIAPYGLRPAILRFIDREIMRAESSDTPGRIMAKMNSLVDPEIIEALYKASKAGVQIQLNVRGICCLRPGVKSLSENIEVVSIVDQFLEHSRIFYFANGGEPEIYLSSADWMQRNLDRRIEILFPVEHGDHRGRLTELLEWYFGENAKAWVLHTDGTYAKKDAGKNKPFRIQEWLCHRAIEREKARKTALLRELRPQKPKKSKKA